MEYSVFLVGACHGLDDISFHPEIVMRCLNFIYILFGLLVSIL